MLADFPFVPSLAIQHTHTHTHTHTHKDTQDLKQFLFRAVFYSAVLIHQ